MYGGSWLQSRGGLFWSGHRRHHRMTGGPILPCLPLAWSPDVLQPGAHPEFCDWRGGVEVVYREAMYNMFDVKNYVIKIMS